MKKIKLSIIFIVFLFLSTYMDFHSANSNKDERKNESIFPILFSIPKNSIILNIKILMDFMDKDEK